MTYPTNSLFYASVSEIFGIPSTWQSWKNETINLRLGFIAENIPSLVVEPRLICPILDSQKKHVESATGKRCKKKPPIELVRLMCTVPVNLHLPAVHAVPAISQRPGVQPDQTSTTSISPSAGFRAFGAGGTGLDLFCSMPCQELGCSGIGDFHADFMGTSLSWKFMVHGNSW